MSAWAPWCPHCRDELPILDGVAEEGLTFPVAVDDADGTLASALGIRSFPTTYFVDAEGRVVHTMVGPGPRRR